MKIVFVVLHYIVEEETLACVKKLKENVDTSDYQIVIVDNASSNQSGKSLQEQFAQDEKVTVLLNAENLGFARGNNVGFSYAKEKWNPEFIVLMNNDVFLLEPSIYTKCAALYQEYEFGVMGPLIMTADGHCDCNPYRMKPLQKKDVDYLKHLFEQKQFYWKWNLTPFIERMMFIRNTLNGSLAKRKNKPYTKVQEGVVLHGCFLVFSQKYIQTFDGLDERTFLYCEEDILWEHVAHAGMKMLYTPDIVVFHEEDVATNAIMKKSKEKEMLKIKNHLQSLDILMQVKRSCKNES